MSEDTAIKSAIRRSLHFVFDENTNSKNIGRMSDKSYYKFFIYDDKNFLEVEIMGGEILSARYSRSDENTTNKVFLYLSEDISETDSDGNTFTRKEFKIDGFTPKFLDVEYSFGIFTLSSSLSGTFKDKNNKEILPKEIVPKESKYYGTLVSDASKFASTLEVGNVNLGPDSKLTVQKIKLGNWNIENKENETVNITYGG